MPVCLPTVTFSRMDLCPRQLDIYRTVIPMRRFEHSAAAREAAEAIVVRLELGGGAVGWGETLPRPYVTGETPESATQDIEQIMWPALLAGSPPPERALAELDVGDALPMEVAGRKVTAARCAVELAWLDALAVAHGLPLGRPVGREVRVSGVLGSSVPDRTARHLRLMRIFGLRDFKLKLGLGADVDRQNLAIVHRRMAQGLAAGKLTLRVDVNGGWRPEDTPERSAELAALGVCAIEQPVFCGAAELAELGGRCALPLLADESLVTPADAAALLAAKGRVWLNIRLSKNGGIGPSLAIARRAVEAGVPWVSGCMVGESSILSAAQRVLLGRAPRPRFVEGNYGRFLLAGDLCRRSLRFGYAGRLTELKGPGFGAAVDPARLSQSGRLVKSLRA